MLILNSPDLKEGVGCGVWGRKPLSSVGVKIFSSALTTDYWLGDSSPKVRFLIFARGLMINS
jgi:hypothetical protein